VRFLIANSHPSCSAQAVGEQTRVRQDGGLFEGGREGGSLYLLPRRLHRPLFLGVDIFWAMVMALKILAGCFISPFSLTGVSVISFEVRSILNFLDNHGEVCYFLSFISEDSLLHAPQQRRKTTCSNKIHYLHTPFY
jgi:hypothetical protein